MWTPEEIALMTQFANEGYSSSQIARALATKTRNAVIGKLNRLGIRLKNGQKPYEKKPVVEKPKPVPAVIEIKRRDPFPPQVIPEQLTELIDLQPDQCRWPFGDKNFKFCGMPKTSGSSYCHRHKLVSEGRDETSI